MRAKTKRARRRQWAQAYVAAQRGLGEYPYRFGVSPLQWSAVAATAQARKRARGAHDIYTQVARGKADLPRNTRKNETRMLWDSWRSRDAWRRYATPLDAPLSPESAAMLRAGTTSAVEHPAVYLGDFSRHIDE